MLSLVSLFFSGYLFGVFAEESSLQSISVKYDSDTWNKFSSFQVTFHKKYDSLDELEKRFDIFKLNYDSMLDHNKASIFNFTLGVNQFSDLTSQEFKEQFISGFNPHTQDQLYGTTLGSYDCNSSTEGEPSDGTPFANVEIRIGLLQALFQEPVAKKVTYLPRKLSLMALSWWRTDPLQWQFATSVMIAPSGPAICQ